MDETNTWETYIADERNDSAVGPGSRSRPALTDLFDDEPPRPVHSPPEYSERPRERVLHLQFPGIVNSASLRYGKSGDLNVTVTIPAKHVDKATDLYKFFGKLLSLDLVVLPRKQEGIEHEWKDGQWIPKLI